MCFRLSCMCRVDHWANDWSQYKHANGLSFVWIRSWTYKEHLWLKVMGHRAHLIGFSFTILPVSFFSFWCWCFNFIRNLNFPSNPEFPELLSFFFSRVIALLNEDSDLDLDSNSLPASRTARVSGSGSGPDLTRTGFGLGCFKVPPNSCPDSGLNRKIGFSRDLSLCKWVDHSWTRSSSLFLEERPQNLHTNQIIENYGFVRTLTIFFNQT